MIVTADERVRNEAIIYRDQGKAGFLGGEHVRMGSAWRMSELHAAVGLVQLKRLDEFISARQRAAAVYDEILGRLDGIDPLSIPAGCVTNYYKYVAMLAPGIDRSDVKARLREDHDVWLSGEVYSLPLHQQPVFARDGPTVLPVAEDVCARHVCLPIHGDMTEDEAIYVGDSLGAVLAGTGGSTHP
jgi:dTDP-4-amino-4,6-dideoxygalactose transaminase